MNYCIDSGKIDVEPIPESEKSSRNDIQTENESKASKNKQANTKINKR